jgi:leader peptidase (prepilin peptidase) / N-methyltransferase
VSGIARWGERAAVRRHIGTYAALIALALGAAAASIAAAPGLRGFLGAALALVALAIAVVDARRFIIPNELNLAGLALGLVHAAWLAPDAIVTALMLALVRGAALALLFLALRAAYAYWRGRHGLGLGDVKLAGVAGVWLDWLTIPIAVEIAALTALAFYLVRHFAGRPGRLTDRLPFGAFLAPAIWIAWLMEATVLSAT